MSSSQIVQMEKLKIENKSLRETCEILADEDIMNSIKKSLKEIAEGNSIPLEKL